MLMEITTQIGNKSLIKIMAQSSKNMAQQNGKIMAQQNYGTARLWHRARWQDYGTEQAR